VAGVESGSETPTLTRMPKLHEAVLPEASLAVQVTFVRPSRKSEPEGCEQVTGEDSSAALPPLRALHPGVRVLTLEQAPLTQAGTAVIERSVPERTDGFELLQEPRGALPGVRSASIDPG
jgi:hypothetical protein